MEYSEFLKAILAAARRRAVERKQVFCGCEQVLEVLLTHLHETDAARPVTAFLDAKQPLPFEPPDAEYARALRIHGLGAAEKVAVEEGSAEIKPEHLMHVLISSSSPISDDLRERVIQRLGSGNGTSPERTPAVGGKNAYGTAARAGGTEQFLIPIVPDDADRHLADRPHLLDRLMSVTLFGNALLVGPVGSGRRSIIRMLASRLHDRRCPEVLEGYRLLLLDPTRIIAGTSYRGELEERVYRIVESLTEDEHRTILVIEELHLIVGSGDVGGGLDVASSLVPYLRRGSLKLVGCTTPDLLREKLEKAPAFLDTMERINVDPPDAVEAGRLLAAVPGMLTGTFGVGFDENTVDTAVSLCRHHLPHLALPGVAQKLLRGAAATLAFEKAMLARDPQRVASNYWSHVSGARNGKGKEDTVTERHILYELSQQHRIPIEHLESGVEEKIRGFERAFKEHIFGQDHVLTTLNIIVKLSLMNMSDSQRPRGRVFFIGPPGTGKTECAKLIATYLMGSEDALIRFDMSEFQNESSVSSLIGSDKGLVGSDEGGRLTEPVRQNPHRVILFDEIEKAHPGVYDLFLQILDFGEIHDKQGRRVSFRHAICIFTSNAGCDGEHNLFGLSRPEIEGRLRTIFRDALLNRVEDFIPFRSLTEADRRKIADYRLNLFADDLKREYRCALEWGDDVLVLAAQPPERDVGARHILHWIARTAKPAVADLLLEKHMLDGRGGIITLSTDGNRVVAALRRPKEK